MGNNIGGVICKAGELECAGISESILKTADKISDSILSLSVSISSETAIVAAIVGALVGTFSAFIFNYFYTKAIRKKERLSRLAGNLNGLIEELETLSVAYWVADYTVHKKEELAATEIRIKSINRVIGKYITLLRDNIGAKEFDRELYALSDFNMQIFDIVTGDGFESPDRKGSKKTAARISTKCAKAKSKLCEAITIN